MRLESIVLHGFKSFAERTEIKVLPGVTCVVGPNGCGKTNVGESIKWALGEQSAKSLRGQRMEDVIFYGSQSRKAVGMAEVELRFSNEDGAVGVPWSEIAVAGGSTGRARASISSTRPSRGCATSSTSSPAPGPTRGPTR